MVRFHAHTKWVFVRVGFDSSSATNWFGLASAASTFLVTGPYSSLINLRLGIIDPRFGRIISPFMSMSPGSFATSEGLMIEPQKVAIIAITVSRHPSAPILYLLFPRVTCAHRGSRWQYICGIICRFW